MTVSELIAALETYEAAKVEIETKDPDSDVREEIQALWQARRRVREALAEVSEEF